MIKLNYIDRIETKLHKVEIEEKLRDIVLEDRFINIYTAGKKLCRLDYKENIYSFFLLSIGKHDMLSPRIYMTVFEKNEGSICNLFYSKTWEFWCLFIWWNMFWGICIIVLRVSKLKLICCIVIYALGVLFARKHCISICMKVVNILKYQLKTSENKGNCHTIDV